MWTGRCPRGHIPPWSPREESLLCFCFNLLFWNLKTIQPFPEMLTKWGILMGSEKSCLLSVDKGALVWVGSTTNPCFWPSICDDRGLSEGSVAAGVKPQHRSVNGSLGP